MTMTDFLTAVKTRLETLTYNPALSGIWADLAPDETEGTFIIYSVPGNDEGQSMGTNPARWQDIVVTFDVFDDGTSPAVVATIGDQLRSLFNVPQPLGVSVPLCTTATRTSYAIIPDPDGGYHLSVDYVFTTEDS